MSAHNFGNKPTLRSNVLFGPEFIERTRRQLEGSTDARHQYVLARYPIMTSYQDSAELDEGAGTRRACLIS